MTSLIMVGTCHPSMCHVTDLIFMVYWLSNLGQVSVNRSVSPLPYSLDSPHIDHGGCMSARHVSPDLDLIFRVY